MKTSEVEEGCGFGSGGCCGLATQRCSAKYVERGASMRERDGPIKKERKVHRHGSVHWTRWGFGRGPRVRLDVCVCVWVC